MTKMKRKQDLTMKLFLALTVALALGCLAALCMTGCSTSPTGLAKEQSWSQAIGDKLSVVGRDVLPFVPPPYQSAAGAAVSLLVAANGLYAGWVHRKVSGLATASQSANAVPPGNGATAAPPA